jgi:undecaprenyl diphosphate synthase
MGFGKNKKSAGTLHGKGGQSHGGEVKIPRHIAIIMDGNGRWAKKRGLPRSAGHSAGAETFRKIVRYCRDIGVEHLTVYVFSTENWRRDSEEVSAIMSLLEKYLVEAIQTMEEEGASLYVMGDISRLSPRLQELSREALGVAAHLANARIKVNVCFNYGGRDEIVRAARRFAEDCLSGGAKPEELDVEPVFGLYVFKRHTGPGADNKAGRRIAHINFLLWQSAYSELYFTDVLWARLYAPRAGQGHTVILGGATGGSGTQNSPRRAYRREICDLRRRIWLPNPHRTRINEDIQRSFPRL